MDLLDEHNGLFPAARTKRFVNYLIDILATGLVGMLMDVLLEAIIYGLSGDEAALQYRAMVNFQYGVTASIFLISLGIGFVNSTLYYTIMEYYFKGKTVGKYLTRTHAVSLDDSPLTFKQALLRSVIRYVPLEPLSFFMGRGLTGWHDDWSGTVVVDD